MRAAKKMGQAAVAIHSQIQAWHILLGFAATMAALGASYANTRAEIKAELRDTQTQVQQVKADVQEIQGDRKIAIKESRERWDRQERATAEIQTDIKWIKEALRRRP